MRDGFVKVGAATPDILVADCVHNREEIVKKVKEMAEAGTKVMAFPGALYYGIYLFRLVLAGTASCACEGRTSQT